MPIEKRKQIRNQPDTEGPNKKLAQEALEKLFQSQYIDRTYANVKKQESNKTS